MVPLLPNPTLIAVIRRTARPGSKTRLHQDSVLLGAGPRRGRRSTRITARFAGIATCTRDTHIGFQQRPVGLEHRAIALIDDTAALDDDGSIRHTQYLMRVLLDENRRKTFLADDLAQDGEEFLDDDRRKPFEWLIEQHD